MPEVRPFFHCLLEVCLHLLYSYRTHKLAQDKCDMREALRMLQLHQLSELGRVRCVQISNVNIALL
jgi:hypothetical protein